MRTKIDEHEARHIANGLEIIVKGVNDTLDVEDHVIRYARQAGVARAASEWIEETLKNIFNVGVEK